jgi:hypothetical protein
MSDSKIMNPNIPDWGIDLPSERRPGVPREAKPRAFPNAHWMTPEPQKATVPVLKRADIPALTPVFGTSSPPRGLSGQLRRLAYARPDHYTMHWMLLLAADRVDVIESGLRSIVDRFQRRPTPAEDAGSSSEKQRLPRPQMSPDQAAQHG